jgi:acyl carrier protein
MTRSGTQYLGSGPELDAEFRRRVIEAWLHDWFAGRGHRLTREQNYFDAGGVDSESAWPFVLEVETHFGVTFENRDWQDRRFPTIAGLAEMIDERVHKV